MFKYLVKKDQHAILLSGIIIALYIFLCSSIAYAASATLVWEKPDDSRVVGYNIYVCDYGTPCEVPITTVMGVDNTSYVIQGLEDGQRIFVSATSIDADGNESIRSDTLDYLVEVPVVPVVIQVPRKLQRVQRITIELVEEDP